MVTFKTGLIINKKLGEKLAARLFIENKRATEVMIRAFNIVVVYGYRGKRSDVDEIKNNVALLRRFKLEVAL